MAFGSDFLAGLTIIAHVILIFYLYTLVHYALTKKIPFQYFWKNMKEEALWIAFIVSIVATFGSLYYSEILGYLPCKLCWYQRILMYPQALLFGIALLKKDKKYIGYLAPLSLIGLIIAGFHYIAQLSPVKLVSCGISGLTPSCSEYFSLMFGYITIPLMAFTAFLLLLMLTKLPKLKEVKEAPKTKSTLKNRKR